MNCHFFSTDQYFNFIAFQTASKLAKIDGNNGYITVVRTNNPYAVFFKIDGVNIYAILIGISILALSVFSLYKHGFFNRTKKEEIQRLTKSMHVDESGLEMFEEFEFKNQL